MRVQYARVLADDADPQGLRRYVALVQAGLIRWRDDGQHIAWGGLIISLDWDQALAIGHVAAAVSELFLGAAVLLMVKGTLPTG